MPGPDPSHWLNRLTAAEWLAAAENEIEHAEAAFSRRAVRPGVTHARRAAGMAWNAVLAASTSAGTDDGRYGRSYMDHLHALANDTALPAEVQTAARLLRDTSPTPPVLADPHRPGLAAQQAARAILDYARGRLA